MVPQDELAAFNSVLRAEVNQQNDSELSMANQVNGRPPTWRGRQGERAVSRRRWASSPSLGGSRARPGRWGGRCCCRATRAGQLRRVRGGR